MVTVAHARAALVGDTQPNAVDVREFYRERSPAGLLAELDLLDADQLLLRAESMVEALLSPIARQLDLDLQALGTVGGAVAVLNAIAKSTPAPALGRTAVPEARVAPGDGESPPDTLPPFLVAHDAPPDSPPPRPEAPAPISPFSAEPDALDLDDATTDHDDGDVRR